MKKFFTVIMAGIIFLTASKVFAYEIFWYDKNCGFNKFAKIVLFPLSNSWENPYDYLLGNEGTRNFTFNSYLDQSLTKKLKKVNFIRLANEIHEKEEILTGLHGELLQPFDSEQARAAAVEEATMADMYIVPQFRENRVQEDISPRCEWDIELKSWTEEKDGPNGNRIYDERKRVVHHVIPEKKIYLHIMQLEFTGYNNRAEKVFTSLQQYRSYNFDEETQFKYLVDSFQKSFVDARGEKNSDKGKIRIGFTPVDIEGDFHDDIFFGNAMNAALETSATKKIKKVRVVRDPELPADYYIRSTITRCELTPIWHKPYYYVSNDLVNSEQRKWRDRDGNEHEMTINHYDQSIDDVYAFYSFHWQVAAQFELVDSKNNVILSQSDSDDDDKPVDAYRHIAEKFCKQVNSKLKK